MFSGSESSSMVGSTYLPLCSISCSLHCWQWCPLPFAFLLGRRRAIVETEVVVCIRLSAQNNNLPGCFPLEKKKSLFFHSLSLWTVDLHISPSIFQCLCLIWVNLFPLRYSRCNALCDLESFWTLLLSDTVKCWGILIVFIYSLRTYYSHHMHLHVCIVEDHLEINWGYCKFWITN